MPGPPKSVTPAASAPPSQIAVEAAGLREMLRASGVGGGTEAVDLPADDPARLRAFWAAVGWNDAWAPRWKLHRPERDLAARRAGALLRQLEVESPSAAALRPGALPERFRLVDIDSAGLGFALTNEDDAQTREDPPVLAVIFETGDVVPLAPSYLTWCANQLVSVALSAWYELDVSVASLDSVLAADAPLAALSPATRRLASGLWAVPPAPEATSPGPDLRLAYDSFAAVVRWLTAQPQGQEVSIPIFTDGAIALAPDAAARAERLFDPGARRLAGLEPDESYVAGSRDGRPLLLKRSPEGDDLVTSEDQLDWLQSQLSTL